MRISNKIFYAVVALVHIHQNESKGYVSVNDISRRYGISIKYLENIMTQLRSALLVKSIKGSIGGYKLGKPPQSISLYAIYTAFAPRESIIEFVHTSAHDPTMAGVLELLKRGEESFYKMLECISLEEFVSTVERRSMQLSSNYYI